MWFFGSKTKRVDREVIFVRDDLGRCCVFKDDLANKKRFKAAGRGDTDEKAIANLHYNESHNS